MSIHKGLIVTVSRSFGVVSLVLLIAALWLPHAIAQSDGQPFEAHPLRPADTSSPRDTLRTFNASITEAARAFYASQSKEVIARVTRGAQETFDFSHMPRFFATRVDQLLQPPPLALPNHIVLTL